MTPPPDAAARTAFMVHGLGQAQAACAAAAETGRAIMLLSAPGAAQFAGIGWFRALVDAARAEFPTVDMLAILHCGDAAGRALQALSNGLSHLVVDPRCPALPRLRDIAGQCGATILTEMPQHIDLGTVADPAAASRAALLCPAGASRAGLADRRED